MTINFSKYHGCGNDFICIDCRNESYSLEELAPKLCNRGFSIGADGIVGLYNSNNADFKMVIVNSDGSTPEMCGNGLRCLIAFAIDNDITKKTTLTIETAAGILSARIINTSNNISTINIDMGEANTKQNLPEKDFDIENTNSINISIELNDRPYIFTPVSMGNPHAVIFVENLSSLPVDIIGPISENHPFFPNRVNTEFVEVINESELHMRVWERGVGETNACGTGACASVVAATLTKQCNGKATVKLNGGTLDIEFDQETNQVKMEGPAEFLFKSEITI